MMPIGEVAGRPVRPRLRDSALQAIRFAGGLAAASSSRWRSRRLLILCYHGFAQDDEHLWNSSLHVTRRHLAHDWGSWTRGGTWSFPSGGAGPPGHRDAPLSSWFDHCR